MAFDSNYQYFKGYTWSFNGYQKKEKEKGQLAYPSPLTHTHNRRIRGNPLLVVPGPVPELRLMMAHHWVKVAGSATAPDSDLPRQQDYDEEETGDSKSMRMTLSNGGSITTRTQRQRSKIIIVLIIGSHEHVFM